MFNRLALLCFLLLLGCQSNTNYYVHVDNDFSDEEKHQIVEGLNDWNDKSPIVHFEGMRPMDHGEIWSRSTSIWHDDGDLYITTCEHDGAVCNCPGGRVIGNVEGEPGYVDGATLKGRSFKNNKVICIDSEWAANNNGMPRTIRHEAGHVLGLDHNEDLSQPSVMHPFWQNDTDTVQQADLDNLCAVDGC